MSLQYAPSGTSNTVSRNYSGYAFQDPGSQAYASQNPDRVDALYFLEPVQSNIIGLWQAGGGLANYQYSNKTFTCLAGLNVGDPVRVSANDTVVLATSDTSANAKVIGFVAIKPTATSCQITHFYRGSTIGLNAGESLYLTDVGGISETPGTVQTELGKSLSTTDYYVSALPEGAISGYSGASGTSGYSGFTGESGYSGYSGLSSASGYSGYSGFTGASGFSGIDGDSGYSGYSGTSGFSGSYSGESGYSGISGFSGTYSGFSGFSGFAPFTGAKALFSGTSWSSASGAWTTQALNVEFWDTDNYHDNDTNNSRMTIPRDGIYRVDASCSFGSIPGVSAMSGCRGVRVIKGGSEVLTAQQSPEVASAQTLLHATGAFSATAGEYVELQTWQNSGKAWMSIPMSAGIWYAYVPTLELSDLNAQGDSGLSGAVGDSGYSGTSGTSGFSGTYSGCSGESGTSGFSGTSGTSGTSGYSGFTGQSGTSGYSGISGISGTSGYSGVSGQPGSGHSGESGTSGYSGKSGYSGVEGLSGFSGLVGATGTSGTSAYSGTSGTSGYSAFSGKSGYSGIEGSSGLSGKSGYSGHSGLEGTSGTSGKSGYSGLSGPSGFSGAGWSGTSGASGKSGTSGYSATSGQSGTSGYSGTSGTSGFSGQFSGESGFSGEVGPSGASGKSGYSGAWGGVDTIQFVIDGGEYPLSNGIKGTLWFDYGFTITDWIVLADQDGSVELDIWKSTYASYPPTALNSIVGNNPPFISSAQKGRAINMTGWGTTVAAGSALTYYVTECSSITRCTVILKITRL